MKLKKQFSLLELLGFVTVAGIVAFLWSLSDLDGGVKLVASGCVSTFLISYFFRSGAIAGVAPGIATMVGIIVVWCIADGYSATQIVAGLVWVAPGLCIYGIVPIVLSWCVASNLSQRFDRLAKPPSESIDSP